VAASPSGERRVRVWDLPSRVVHWLIAILIAVSWWTHRIDAMNWHRLSGYAVLALVIFRIYWGFAGSTTARFASFVKGPVGFGRYARKVFDRVHGEVTLGHNPMGGWSVLAMLALLLLQTGLGLFTIDEDGLESGPLAAFVSFDTGRLAAHWHHLTFNLLLALIALHVAVVLFYLIWRRDNLISAMIGGKKRIPGETRAELLFAPLWRAVLGLALAALVVWAISTAGFHRFGH
jgi:cytochrome b